MLHALVSFVVLIVVFEMVRGGYRVSSQRDQRAVKALGIFIIAYVAFVVYLNT